MAEKRLKRPRDPIALAKLIGDIATGQVQDKTNDGKNPHAVALGKLGGARTMGTRLGLLPDQHLLSLPTLQTAAQWREYSCR